MGYISNLIFYFTNIIIFIITWTYWIFSNRQIGNNNCFFTNAICIL